MTGFTVRLLRPGYDQPKKFNDSIEAIDYIKSFNLPTKEFSIKNEKTGEMVKKTWEDWRKIDAEDNLILKGSLMIKLTDIYKAMKRKQADDRQMSFNFDEPSEPETLKHKESVQVHATTRTNPTTGKISPVKEFTREQEKKQDQSYKEKLKELIENSPTKIQTPPDDLMGWDTNDVHVCAHCAGRIMGRGIKLENAKPVWDKTDKTCDVCGKPSDPKNRKSDESSLDLTSKMKDLENAVAGKFDLAGKVYPMMPTKDEYNDRMRDDPLEEAPDEVKKNPDNFIIFNSTRGLAGDYTWEDDFRHGVFYAAVKRVDKHPQMDEFDKRNFDSMLKTNQSLDAYVAMPLKDKDDLANAVASHIIKNEKETGEKYYTKYYDTKEKIAEILKRDRYSGVYSMFKKFVFPKVEKSLQLRIHL